MATTTSTEATMPPEPPCPIGCRAPLVGRISSHADLAAAARAGQAHASTLVCDRADHQKVARAWVHALTGRQAVAVALPPAGRVLTRIPVRMSQPEVVES